jgi:hypothetical protein
MTESHQVHQELLGALHHLIPRTVYQDSRRLDTLAWAITGLCLMRTVHLSAWAEVTQSRAQTVASRIQRVSGWLHHPAISPADWYRPVVQAALAQWPAAQRLYVALDTTALTPFVLIRASLIYRGRAIPLAWRAMQHQSTTVASAGLSAGAGAGSRPAACGQHDHAPGRSRLCPQAEARSTSSSSSGTFACA